MWPQRRPQPTPACAVAAQPALKRRQYEHGHWDTVIDGFREIERPIEALPPATAAIAARMRALVFPPSVRTLPFLHILDLSADGEIRSHVDSVKFSGNYIVVCSLLASAVVELQHEHSDARVRMRVPRRSLYVMQGAARYDWGHAVKQGTQQFEAWPPGAPAALGPPETVDRQRRLSLILRDELPPVAGAPPAADAAIADRYR